MWELNDMIHIKFLAHYMTYMLHIPLMVEIFEISTCYIIIFKIKTSKSKSHV